MLNQIKFIDESDISNKRVIVRVDYNVPFDKDGNISDDTRIKESVPTLTYLLKKNNTLIIISHMGRPENKDPNYSFSKILGALKSYFESYNINFVENFISQRTLFDNPDKNTIFILENLRFFPEEKTNDSRFAHDLASLGDVYVNDAFSVSHRKETSIVGIPPLLPSYAGLLLKREIVAMDKILNSPQKPMIAILAGSKISTKLILIKKLISICDYLLLGGGIANTFLAANGIMIGKSICESEMIHEASEILAQAKNKIILPSDAVVSKNTDSDFGENKDIKSLAESEMILDIGMESIKRYSEIIKTARTIVWNGPVGYFENPAFSEGSKQIYYAIIQNPSAVSIAGGGDTLAAIADLPNKDKFFHLSTAGGAMLEFLEKGTLPGIEALKNK